MVDIVVSNSSLKGRVQVPPSKSQTLRALVFATLAGGKSRISGPLESPDAAAMIQACRNLGAKMIQNDNFIEVTGTGGDIKVASDVIDAGNSGIVLRFISAVAALSNDHVIVTGDHSIQYNRPMQPLLEGLQQLGAKAISTKGDGRAPVMIQGPLQGGMASISGEDSQPVSSLLIAGALCRNPVTLFVNSPGETPWIDLTLSWMDRLGLSYQNDGYQSYLLAGGEKIQAFNYQVPGDFSSAAFPILAAIITDSELFLDNLDFSEAQGDRYLIDVLVEMGAEIEMDPAKKVLHVKRGGRLRGIEVDVNRIIDAIPALAVVGCFAEGETVLRNAAIARMKESDRLGVMATELNKMGGKVREIDDGLVIRSASLVGSQELDSHWDHRVAMALSVAGMSARGESRLSRAECIAKTYPDFVQAFQCIGANIKGVQ